MVDGERAFWGDPLAELASTALFRDPAKDAGFLSGFAETAGHPLDLGPGPAMRLGLYRAYLYLVMVVERAPRRYQGLESRAVDVFVRNRLARELRALRRALA